MIRFQMHLKGRGATLITTFALTLLAGHAQATSPLLSSPRAVPGSPFFQATPMMNPYASTDPRLNAVRPVLEVLVTLRQLADPALALTASQRESVGFLLMVPQALPMMEVDDASRLNAALNAELSDSQRQLLERVRATQTARLRTLLSRARLATPDGPPQLARLAYGQLLGADTVTALLTNSDAATVTRLVRAAALRTQAALKL
ncbi:hypothetical protein E7T06_15240 [Deinococcus sp. Arct2-2]|uniref:hypothetical protein n=1 Tax=Deinococcus sp. Arct2-2 TaxID=2568653 RepID=UPI0010A45456|nr:hypothetical protein [Deinococcus sp. Arct2-2]THF68719.1 hypothetical protein E7T06_15240 [Deinococcus sp. Arct2-2]